MSFEFWHELAIPVRIEFVHGEVTGVIDAPPEVAAWLEDKLGVAGMLAIHDEAQAIHYAKEDDMAGLDEIDREDYRANEALKLADYGA